MPLPIRRANILDIPAVLRPGHNPATSTAATNLPAAGPRHGVPPPLGMMPRRYKQGSGQTGAPSLPPRQPLASLLGTAPVKSTPMGPMAQYVQTPPRPPVPAALRPGGGYGMAAQPPLSAYFKPNRPPVAPPPMPTQARPQPRPPLPERPSQYLRPNYPSTSLHGMPTSAPTHRPPAPTGMTPAQAPMKRPGAHGAAPTSAPAKPAGTAPAAAKSKWDGRPVLVNDQSWFTLSHKFQMEMQKFRGTDRGASAAKVLSDHMTGNQQHVYMLNGGKPVGVMTSDLRSDGHVHINGVVTHPDTKGVGGALIEAAVNMSAKNGGSGMVHLQFLDQASRAAYSKLGFRFEGGSGVNLILVPATRPDLWEKTADGYRLKKPAPKMV
ncbi:GNAT family N-acetyltransferase [Pandoraea anhela]|uniref:N-acetyltransferase domain-containing protein n=1 Tax=Pandoraea anhela TaxID=2508295 RepID=A0A5E4YQT5_9BURK|nr:GNAT family N-acetyltransferase [Pandoraea anhela]VVE50775.1 hypothetical protein PAN31108_04686 [Pandoraea anhela]